MLQGLVSPRAQVQTLEVLTEPERSQQRAGAGSLDPVWTCSVRRNSFLNELEFSESVIFFCIFLLQEDIVKLDIGGKFFDIKRKHLCRIPGVLPTANC